MIIEVIFMSISVLLTILFVGWIGLLAYKSFRGEKNMKWYDYILAETITFATVAVATLAADKCGFSPTEIGEEPAFWEPGMPRRYRNN